MFLDIFQLIFLLKMLSSISIVIPTYNRAKQVEEVILCLLKSDTTGFSSVQIIVVEDGSLSPCRDVIERIVVKAPFQLKYVWQENAGPSVARNTGFKNATHDVVLFIDDDILVFPDMISKHLKGHQQFPDSVIYGYCPYVVPEKETPAYRFLTKLTDPGSASDYIPTSAIASGNISVEKKMFPDGEFYKSSLRTPAAEEFELMARLRDQKIKIYFNPSIRGWHLQPATIEDKCKQEYKYGMGVAEVGVKVPYALSHENLKKLYYENCPVQSGDRFSLKLKKGVKSLLAKAWIRSALLSFVKGMERIIPIYGILIPFYRLLAGLNVFAGVREGLKKFGSPSA